MGNSNESEIRLAELIWRTVKLRVSLLILTIVALIVVWSSLSNGRQAARRIDAAFCGNLVDQQNAISNRLKEPLNKPKQLKSGASRTQSPMLVSKDDVCRPGSARTWIEITRDTDKELPWWTTFPTFPTLNLMVKAAKERQKSFEKYDMERREAYRLQFQLSSENSSSTITVNALTAAEVVPFCVLVVFTLVVILGFQQAAYRRQLRLLLGKRSDDALYQITAETQFFAAPIRQGTPHLAKLLQLSPSGLAIAALSVANLLLLLDVISNLTLAFVHLTGSIIGSYTFALYAFAFLLGYALVVTRRSYFENDQSDSGHRCEGSAKPSPKYSTWVTVSFASLAIISLAFRWTTESAFGSGPFRGFEFLLNQHPTGHIFNYTTYALSPPIFRDVRIQATVAVTFILICVLDSLFHARRTKPLLMFLHEIRRFLAVCVLGLSVYFLAYLGTLQYESVYWVPWLDTFAYQGWKNAKGSPMIFYNPTYGFWIFLVCCLSLVLLSLRTQTNGLPSWVQRLACISRAIHT